MPGEKDSTIAVVGLWHLGVVIAACLAEAGFTVVGVDPDPEVVAGLNRDRLPVEEPGLTELLRDMRNAGRLTFATASAEAVGAARLIWIAFDTPVDDEDRSDVEWVLERSAEVLAHAAPRRARRPLLATAGRERGGPRPAYGGFGARRSALCLRPRESQARPGFADVPLPGPLRRGRALR